MLFDKNEEEKIGPNHQYNHLIRIDDKSDEASDQIDPFADKEGENTKSDDSFFKKSVPTNGSNMKSTGRIRGKLNKMTSNHANHTKMKKSHHSESYSTKYKLMQGMSQSNGEDSTKNLDIIKLKPTLDPLFSGKKDSIRNMNIIHEEEYQREPQRNPQNYGGNNLMKNVYKEKTTNQIIQEIQELNKKSKNESLQSRRMVNILNNSTIGFEPVP